MILDTCALLWLATGDSNLSRSTVKRINEAPTVYVSAISGFEIALKSAQGKLKLPLPTVEWMNRAVEKHGLTVLPLDLTICLRAAELPHFHDDPFDRFIIASAKVFNQEIVTKDERFEAYAVRVMS